MASSGATARDACRDTGFASATTEADSEELVAHLTQDLQADCRSAVYRVVEFFKDPAGPQHIDAGERFRRLHAFFYDRPWAAVADRLRYAQQVLRLTDARGRDLLEMGAGYGITAIFYVLCGAGTVASLDIDREFGPVLSRWLSALQLEAVPIWPCEGDAANLGLKSGALDLVTADGMLSHVPDLDATLCEARRVLKPGGRLYVQDENNALIAEGRIRRRRGKWADHEKRHRQQRAEILRHKMPDLGADELTRLAERTRGLLAAEVVAVARGAPAPRLVTAAPRDPVTGIYVEREFSPLWLRRQIESKGFDARLVPVFVPAACARPASPFLARLKLKAKLAVTRRPTLAMFLIDSMRMVATAV